jgi:hypothetical protein
MKPLASMMALSNMSEALPFWGLDPSDEQFASLIFLDQGDSHFEGFDVGNGLESYAVKPTETNRLMDVIIGEEVRSLRPLLKRFGLAYTAWYIGARTNVVFYRIIQPNMPASMYDTATAGTFSTGSGFTVTPRGKFLLFDTLRFAFLGARGSCRHLVSMSKSSQSNDHNYMVSVSNVEDHKYRIETTTSTNVNNDDMPVGASFAGGSVTFLKSNETIPVEVPYYEQDRFKICCNTTYVGPTDSGYINGSHAVDIGVATQMYSASGYSDLNEAIYVSWAAGDDFTMHFFLGAPPLFMSIP